MENMLSYCGILCSTCPIYLATREPDKQKQEDKRAEIAQLITEHYDIKFEPANVTDCDGCMTDGGRIFAGCKDCRIRSCAQLKSVRNCAYCREYACEILQTFFLKDPQAKTRLEETRKSLK
jgi:hypothetical protein